MTHYVWIYGLAEALAVSLILTILFSVKWWKLHQERQKLEHTCKAIAAMLKEERISLHGDTAVIPAFRNSRAAYLKTLSIPFRKGRIGDEWVWRDVMGQLDR